MKLLNLKLLVIAVSLFAATSAFASLSYNFNVDTTSVNGQSGYIELQYNQGVLPTGASSASITNFASDATLGTALPTGSISGTLPSAVTINNNPGWNDYYQAVTFGNTISYSLNLSGAPAGNSFALSFWGADGATPLLTTDMTNGIATRVDVNPDGSSAIVTNNSGNVTATPIPAAVYLFGSGLAGLIGMRRKTQN